MCTRLSKSSTGTIYVNAHAKACTHIVLEPHFTIALGCLDSHFSLSLHAPCSDSVSARRLSGRGMGPLGLPGVKCITRCIALILTPTVKWR